MAVGWLKKPGMFHLYGYKSSIGVILQAFMWKALKNEGSFNLFC